MTDTPTTPAPFDAKKVAQRLVGHAGIRDGIAAALQRVYDQGHDAGAEGMRANVVATLKLGIASHERNSHRWALSPQEVLQVAVDTLEALPLTPKTTPKEGVPGAH